jgi:DNA-binding Lrp family transcriptional regulator
MKEEHHLFRAVLLINTEIGSESDVIKNLMKIKGVQNAYPCYGVYDVIAEIKHKTIDGLKEIVTWQVRKIDNVRSTLTMIIVK